VQVSERALYNAALLAQARAMLGAAAGDQRLHAEVPDETAAPVMAAISQHHVGAATGPASLAPSTVCTACRSGRAG
jgi:hypothetical protein